MTAFLMYRLLQVVSLSMAGRSGVMSWYEWSDRHVEKGFVMPYLQRLRMKANPEAQEEVETSFKGSILSRVLRQKRREKEERRWREKEEERKRAKKNLEEHKLALEEHFCRSYVF